MIRGSFLDFIDAHPVAARALLDECPQVVGVTSELERDVGEKHTLKGQGLPRAWREICSGS